MAMTTIGPLHDFAVGWLARYPKPAIWDAEKGPYPVFVRSSLTRRFDVIQFHAPDGYPPATLSEVLPLIFDVDRQFDEEARRRGYRK